jgi:hypothetical protein
MCKFDKLHCQVVRPDSDSAKLLPDLQSLGSSLVSEICSCIATIPTLVIETTVIVYTSTSSDVSSTFTTQTIVSTTTETTFIGSAATDTITLTYNQWTAGGSPDECLLILEPNDPTNTIVYTTSGGAVAAALTDCFSQCLSKNSPLDVPSNELTWG